MQLGPLKVKAQLFCGSETAMGPGKADLSDSGSGLRLLQRQRAIRQSQHLASQGDGAGRHQNHIGPARLGLSHIHRQSRQPCLFQPGIAVDQQSRPDLDDKSFGIADIRCRQGFQGCHGAGVVLFTESRTTSLLWGGDGRHVCIGTPVQGANSGQRVDARLLGGI